MATGHSSHHSLTYRDTWGKDRFDHLNAFVSWLQSDLQASQKLYLAESHPSTRMQLSFTNAHAQLREAGKELVKTCLI
jgi:hypothetical protein